MHDGDDCSVAAEALHAQPQMYGCSQVVVSREKRFVTSLDASGRLSRDHVATQMQLH